MNAGLGCGDGSVAAYFCWKGADARVNKATHSSAITSEWEHGPKHQTRGSVNFSASLASPSPLVRTPNSQEHPRRTAESFRHPTARGGCLLYLLLRRIMLRKGAYRVPGHPTGS